MYVIHIEITTSKCITGPVVQGQTDTYLLLNHREGEGGDFEGFETDEIEVSELMLEATGGKQVVLSDR